MTSEYREPNLTVPQAPADWNAIGDVAIAIAGSAITGLSDQRHIGLLVRDESSALHFVDLGWQYAMGCRLAPVEHYCWLSIDYFPPKRAQVFADMCIEVARKNRATFPYSFFYRDTPYFDEASAATDLEYGEGLSCATFVLEMFRRDNIELLDRASWRAREKDRIAINRALEFLLSDGFAPDRRANSEELKLTHCHHVQAYHVHQQRANIEEIHRYWPEEVAGAAHVYSGTPIECNVAERLGGSVVQQMVVAEMV